MLSADDSVIAWGHGTASGELGFGAGAKKSAARAEKVETLEKLRAQLEAVLLLRVRGHEPRHPSLEPRVAVAGNL